MFDENVLNIVIAEGNQPWDRVALGEVENFILCKVDTVHGSLLVDRRVLVSSSKREGDRRFIKAAREGNARSLRTELISTSYVCRVEEGILIIDGGILRTLHESFI